MTALPVIYWLPRVAIRITNMAVKIAEDIHFRFRLVICGFQQSGYRRITTWKQRDTIKVDRETGSTGCFPWMNVIGKLSCVRLPQDSSKERKAADENNTTPKTVSFLGKTIWMTFGRRGRISFFLHIPADVFSYKIIEITMAAAKMLRHIAV